MNWSLQSNMHEQHSVCVRQISEGSCAELQWGKCLLLVWTAQRCACAETALLKLLAFEGT